MKVAFTQLATGFLYRALFRPDTLPDKPYKAPDEIGAAEIAKIQDWFMKTPKPGLVKRVGFADDGSEVADPPDNFTGKIQFQFIAKTLSLKENFVARLKQLVEHHKESGRLIHNCRAYEELRLGLIGQTLDMSDVEEPEAPAKDEVAAARKADVQKEPATADKK